MHIIIGKNNLIFIHCLFNFYYILTPQNWKQFIYSAYLKIFITQTMFSIQNYKLIVIYYFQT